ncbi:MAG: hypothetical protein ACE5E6_10815 [Phycisphaerae bacterium]
MTSTRTTLRGVSVVVGLLGLGAGSARADFTPIQGSRETSFLQILDTIYAEGVSGTFNGARFGGSVYTSTIGITAVRVDDFGAPGGTLSLLDGYGNTGGPGTSSGLDQTWTLDRATLSGDVRFVHRSHAFGFTDAVGYHELLEVRSRPPRFLAPGLISFDDVVVAGPDWTWDRSDANRNDQVGPHHASSDETTNRLDRQDAHRDDHLITYEITGLDRPGPTWLLFWEDRQHGRDRDFNDLVVEVRGVSTVPAPGAAVLALLGLGLASLVRRPRRTAV